MGKSQIDAAALTTTVLAAGLTIMLVPGPFNWSSTIGGFTLGLILVAWDQQGFRSIFQSIVYALVCALCFTLGLAMALQKLVNHDSFTDWLVATFVFLTVAGAVIDRLKVQNRAPSLYGAPAVQPVAQPYAAPLTQPMPQPTFATPPTINPLQASAFSAPASILNEKPDYPAEPPSNFTLIPPSPAIAPTRAIKEELIYVSLVGEGVNYMRTVRSEHISRDIYRILEEMPEGEVWQYTTGQFVRAKKKNLSSGKALVAYEEVAVQQQA